MSMWDNNAPADASTPRIAPATAGQAGICVTYERPVQGTLHCRVGGAGWDKLHAEMGEEWYE